MDSPDNATTMHLLLGAKLWWRVHFRIAYTSLDLVCMNLGCKASVGPLPKRSLSLIGVLVVQVGHRHCKLVRRASIASAAPIQLLRHGRFCCIPWCFASCKGKTGAGLRQSSMQPRSGCEPSPPLGGKPLLNCTSHWWKVLPRCPRSRPVPAGPPESGDSLFWHLAVYLRQGFSGRSCPFAEVILQTLRC